MTRAALLHLLASPESLSVAAVQDLEQLAQAFPYCQTAHVLLAKAAHDHGSMLAGQRLRRAATYAADRQLLQTLLEQPMRLATPATLLSPSLPPPAVETGALLAVVAPAVALLETLPAPASGALTAEEKTDQQADQAEAPGEEAASPAIMSAEPLAEEAALPVVSHPSDEAAPVTPLPPVAEAQVDLAEVVPVEFVAELLSPALLQREAATEAVVAEEDALIAATVVADATPTAAEIGQLPPIAVAEPPAATPGRPPTKVGVGRSELGLASISVLESGFSSYQLPESELDLDESLAATSSVGAVAPAWPGSGFVGGADMGYALSGGSRLGYAMQAAALADSLPPAEQLNAETPGSPLPPAGEFFAPDALLLEHLASQPPPAPTVPSPLDLIDSFLRRAPQRRRGIVTLLTVPEQADLSLRSTRAEPDLASENLARILAGQGKTERAIAVYERLMVRQPEKSAYFAVQIDLLRNLRTPS